MLRFHSSGGVTDTRRLSYRHVDVEQIGHIYERLLDHDAVTAEHVVLGLRGKPGEEPEIALPDLETKKIDGDDALVAWLSNTDADKAGRRVDTKNQVEQLLAKTVDPSLRARLIQACQGDQTLAARIEPFANLLRLDLRDRPLVFLQGAVYVTETGSRRDSGTAYTTKELADEVAEHALAPLCYSPGPQDAPDTNQWRIRPAANILDLKVCDPAVGSGAILVASCRYLADRLIEAWRAERDPRGAETATAADDPNRLDVVIEARRLVAEHCCYGADRNPMAVEMAKLSMWLTTVAKDRPFTFLDHALKAGDSLLGICNLDQLRHLHYDTAAGSARETPIPGFSPGGDALRAVERLVGQSLELRREMHSIETIRPADVERKQKLHADSREASDNPDDDRRRRRRRSLEHRRRTRPHHRAHRPGGSRCRSHRATRRRPRRHPTKLRPCTVPASVPGCASTPGGQTAPHRATRCTGRSRSRKSSPLEIASMVSMPWWPTRRSSAARKSPARPGRTTATHLITWIAGGTRGSADLVAYFFLNATKISRSFGYLATNTIAQGDTSEVGLTQLIDTGWQIHRAISSTTWPGEATLEIAKVWATAHPWSGQHVLDGRPVVGIDEMLYPLPRSAWRKQRLAENANRSFVGSYVLGMGFTMSSEEAQALIDKDPKNADVLRPYLGGEDLNQSPTQTAPRWIINFFDWPKEKAPQVPRLLLNRRGKGQARAARAKAERRVQEAEPVTAAILDIRRQASESVPDDRFVGECLGDHPPQQVGPAVLRSRQSGLLTRPRHIRIRR